MEGALFCQECGLGLNHVYTDHPENLDGHPLKNQIPARTNSIDHDAGLQQDGKDHLVFLIDSTGRKVKLKLGDTILIGRSDTRLGIDPELDLSLDEGIDHGVSRKHALVRIGNQGLSLIDLESTNGTDLNGRKLPPHEPYPLGDGDLIKFGRLSVRVYIED
jgi:hypothetical protein